MMPYPPASQHERSPLIGDAGAKPASSSAIALALFRARAFTVACFLVYAGPCVIAFQLGSDPDVAYWIDRSALFVAALLPLLFVGQHFLHVLQVRAGQSRMPLLLAASVLPALALSISAGHYGFEANNLQGMLMSDMCLASHLPAKRRLQMAYMDGYGLHLKCLQRYGLDPNTQLLTRYPLLQNCKEWADYHDTHVGTEKLADLHYLATVEANHVCGGFCQPGPMLWTPMRKFHQQDNACASDVGLKFRTVERIADSLFWVSFFIGFVSLIGLAVAPSSLYK
eukprot:TRINITY_DN74442_c0_g1_i1.p1 TRINITY_DN74442_c0_g1~~TRINITY_DN74442_c0_g1_i1.p1  ORF type:complete len:302 (-),score=36.69 TRINITY_DN74442_c0_g1_i1:32-877(-)